MTKSVLVPIAEGSEEIEAVVIIDVLRRAGADVTVASVTERSEVRCSRGTRLVADAIIGDVAGREFDLIALPGGMPGAEGLRRSLPLAALLRAQAAAARPYAAICAAPAVVLQDLGLLTGRRATCHPDFFDRLDTPTRSEDRVVVDGPVITSRGPGTALEFSLTLVERLFGAASRQELARAMLTEN